MARESRLVAALAYLPRYVAGPDLGSLDAAEVDFLIAKNVFRPLPQSLEQQVLQGYEQFVHPIAPSFDLGHVQSIISGRSSSKIPLLLYHSIMCAGLSTIDNREILQYGYESKAELRQACYRKSKLLFDLDIGNDRMLLCTTALLLISWSGLTDKKDASFWAGNAVNEAMSLRLFQHLGSTDIQTRSKRRLWWIVFIREVDVSLSLGKLPRMRVEGLPMLSTNDFEATDATDTNSPNGHLAARSAFVAGMLNLLCIQKATLSMIAFEVLQLSHDSSIRSSLLNVIAPQVHKLTYRLLDWYANLERTIPLLSDSTPPLIDDANRSLLSNTAFVVLTYRLIQITLYKIGITASKRRSLRSSQGPLLPETVLDDYVTGTRNAATQALRMFAALHEHGLIGYIPATGIAVLCAVVYALTSALSLSNLTMYEVATCHGQLDQCLLYLDEMAEMNFSARQVPIIVRSAITRLRDRQKGQAQRSRLLVRNEAREPEGDFEWPSALFPRQQQPEIDSDSFSDVLQEIYQEEEQAAHSPWPNNDILILENYMTM